MLVGGSMKSRLYRLGARFLAILTAVFTFCIRPGRGRHHRGAGASNTYGKGSRAVRPIPRSSRRSCGPREPTSVSSTPASTATPPKACCSALTASCRTAPAPSSCSGGNDRRKGSPDRTSEIQSRLKARGIPVIMIANGTLRLPHQPDGQHLTPEATTCSPSTWRRRSRESSAARRIGPGRRTIVPAS